MKCVAELVLTATIRVRIAAVFVRAFPGLRALPERLLAIGIAGTLWAIAPRPRAAAVIRRRELTASGRRDDGEH
jgi:hypothetical protein